MYKPYKTRHEIITERQVSWLQRFAEQEAPKHIEPVKQAQMNILDIAAANKKIALEAKVEELRERAGLNLMNKIEKEGGSEVKKEASKRYISLRAKIAELSDQEKINQTKEYIEHLVVNRNGYIDTYAILGLLNEQLGIEDEWIKDHKDQLIEIIDAAKKSHTVQEYAKPSPAELAKNEEAVDTKDMEKKYTNNPSGGQ